MADARLMNSPVPFEFEGKVYNVTPEPDFEVEAAFQVWLEREAYVAIWRHKAFLDPADYASRLDTWNRDLAAKEYAFGGDVAYRALRSEPGWKEMAWLLMKHAEAKVGQPEGITRELIERVARDPAKKRELVWLVWGHRGAEPEGKDPNAPGPAGVPPAAS